MAQMPLWLFYHSEVHDMFRNPIGRPLVRLATLPGRVLPPNLSKRTSGHPIRFAGLTAPNRAPDDALMRPRCGSDRLIVEWRPQEWNDLVLCCSLSLYTHIYSASQTSRAPATQVIPHLRARLYYQPIRAASESHQGLIRMLTCEVKCGLICYRPSNRRESND